MFIKLLKLTNLLELRYVYNNDFNFNVLWTVRREILV
jgi:hypothetical protein